MRAVKKSAFTINTARGKIIDEDAMIRDLEDGHVCTLFELSGSLIIMPLGGSKTLTLSRMEAIYARGSFMKFNRYWIHHERQEGNLGSHIDKVRILSFSSSHSTDIRSWLWYNGEIICSFPCKQTTINCRMLFCV